MVVTGFAIGMAVGVMWMVTGGVGIQEGTIAGTYRLLGMSLEEAVVVSVLFRVVFQLIPLALSLSLSWRMLRPTRTSVRLEFAERLTTHHERKKLLPVGARVLDRAGCEGSVVLLVGVVGAADERAGGDVFESHCQAG